MTTRQLTMMLSLLALAGGRECGAQQLDGAEVRLPYSELKELLDAAREKDAKPAPPARPSALLAARLRVGAREGRLGLEAGFRAVAFGTEPALIRLLGGEVALEGADPAEAMVVAALGGLCLATEGAGQHAVDLRLLPATGDGAFDLELPPCASIIVEIGELPAAHAIRFGVAGRETILGSGTRRALPAAGGKLRLELLDEGATRAALSPPEASVWTWQHQALVVPEEDALVYQVVGRASASGGSGMSASLPLPADARDIEVSGDDLVSHRIERGANRQQALRLDWSTRDVLDRRIALGYRIPQAPLGRTWTLQAPGDDTTRARFILAADPLLAFAADHLSAPRQAAGLPAELAERVGAAPCYLLEAGPVAELAVDRVPVAATAEGEVTRAEWEHRIEPDGAMLTKGKLAVSHRGAFELVLDTPASMRLLSCALNGRAAPPVDLGKGVLKLTLPPPGVEPTLVEIAFTGKLPEPLDPVSGTLALDLPKTEAFIHALDWRLDLPSGYQAETHGNLQRVAATPPGPPSRILLAKKLCRDERPEIRVFYQRSGLGAAAR